MANFPVFLVKKLIEKAKFYVYIVQYDKKGVLDLYN